MLNLCSHFFFSSRRRHTRWPRDWSSDVCSSDLLTEPPTGGEHGTSDIPPQTRGGKGACPSNPRLRGPRRPSKCRNEIYRTQAAVMNKRGSSECRAVRASPHRGGRLGAADCGGLGGDRSRAGPSRRIEPWRSPIPHGGTRSLGWTGLQGCTLRELREFNPNSPWAAEIPSRQDQEPEGLTMSTDDHRIGKTRLVLVRGDITEQEVDAVVNAANSTLLGGGGVDGAIHRRGGPAILEECREIRRTRYPDGLPTGEAVTTTAGELPARRVIHTVGPVWGGGGSEEAELLEAAYRNSLERAREEGLRTIAFPSISTGAYGYPTDLAAEAALRTVIATIEAHPDAFDEVRFVLFSESDLETYRDALAKITGG